MDFVLPGGRSDCLVGAQPTDAQNTWANILHAHYAAPSRQTVMML